MKNQNNNNVKQNNVYLKIAQAKRHVKQTPHKKAGNNSFSKYDYFTPEQVELIVYEACESAGLITLFSLVGNEYGVNGVLSIIDIDNGDTVKVSMKTEIPSLKATNATQQLGGAMTYTERYLKMSAFGIAENSLDPDSQDNREVGNKSQKQPEKQQPKPAPVQQPKQRHLAFTEIMAIATKAKTKKELDDLYLQQVSHNPMLSYGDKKLIVEACTNRVYELKEVVTA